jgi:hypothetical protein
MSRAEPGRSTLLKSSNAVMSRVILTLTLRSRETRQDGRACLKLRHKSIQTESTSEIYRYFPNYSEVLWT